MFGNKKRKDVQPAGGNDGALDRTADQIAQHLVATGIDGVGSFDSARAVAEKARSGHGSVEAATKAVIASHLRLAGMNGFITNLGGFVTMPVALPANVVGFYTVATRMVAAVAHLHGHDLDAAPVRSAILLDLIGTDASKVLGGMGAVSGTATSLATRRLSPTALAAVNKAVAFRIGAQLGKRAAGRIPRAIPAAGGVIGAGMDVMLLRKIAESARRDFVRSA